MLLLDLLMFVPLSAFELCCAFTCFHSLAYTLHVTVVVFFKKCDFAIVYFLYMYCSAKTMFLYIPEQYLRMFKKCVFKINVKTIYIKITQINFIFSGNEYEMYHNYYVLMKTHCD